MGATLSTHDYMIMYQQRQRYREREKLKHSSLPTQTTSTSTSSTPLRLCSSIYTSKKKNKQYNRYQQHHDTQLSLPLTSKSLPSSPSNHKTLASSDSTVSIPDITSSTRSTDMDTENDTDTDLLLSIHSSPSTSPTLHLTPHPQYTTQHPQGKHKHPYHLSFNNTHTLYHQLLTLLYQHPHPYPLPLYSHIIIYRHFHHSHYDKVILHYTPLLHICILLGHIEIIQLLTYGYHVDYLEQVEMVIHSRYRSPCGYQDAVQETKNENTLTTTAAGSNSLSASIPVGYIEESSIQYNNITAVDLMKVLGIGVGDDWWNWLPCAARVEIID